MSTGFFVPGYYAVVAQEIPFLILFVLENEISYFSFQRERVKLIRINRKSFFFSKEEENSCIAL